MQNVICITGRVARDPELRRTNSGKAVTSFSVACERDFADKQTGKKEVDFINCVAWGGTAEVVEKHFPKGRMINLTGRLQNRDWTDKNGQKRRTAEILVGNISAVTIKTAHRVTVSLTWHIPRRRMTMPCLKMQIRNCLSSSK